MSYMIEIMPSCQRAIDKACKKNHVLKEMLQKKMKEIISAPFHYKPLKYGLAGERRVHIMKSFVLKFEIDENKNVVIFLAFDHHDNAYNR